MRINQYLALATGISRREADEIIRNKQVTVNSKLAELGQHIDSDDEVKINGLTISPADYRLLVLNKPTGYVVSRHQQDKSPTIYDLLPEKFHDLKPVGRLDKDSCGLILLTNDGKLAHKLTHPSFNKTKTYIVKLDKSLTRQALVAINQGVRLDDGLSRMQVTKVADGYKIKMSEGKNRQIRRTFLKLGYKVLHLQRTGFASLELGNIQPGEYKLIDSDKVLVLKNE